ncbi:hypothetical protein EST38_g1058 [Candolleomyces aberdarensis]|uniref:Protein kinase domain-containing protein n=1 Tax=Candolleomyces aberdarensis TaxID=2316362 RepID=A0A4Q2DVT8_9AGAR|nr:hypothetical protein EST38_g1058 [Candolleomyces aberdarensis]
MASSFSAFIDWPDAPLTASLVRSALKDLSPTHVDSPIQTGNLLQWSTYDSIDHEQGLTRPKQVLSSSYTFRKALIRKHFLSRVIHAYLTKHPDSPLKRAIPATHELEISFADELDEMWTDELWELGEKLDGGDSWWILKPGMADRGMGIRIFNSKEQLQEIFEGFESDEKSDDDSEGQTKASDTAVVTSQLRHFVVQEYLPNPLIFDPHEVSLQGSPKGGALEGHKFHLRVYCVAAGALKVYVYTRILALFAPVPYTEPQAQDGEIDLGPHLTNTSLQTELGEENVRLFDELIGCRIMSNDQRAFTADDLQDILVQISDALGKTFQAAVDSPVHFQPLPNAFELYGVDFLVADNQPNENGSSRFQKQKLVSMDPGPSTPSKKRSKWEDHEDESETLQPPIRPQKKRAKAKSSRKTGELRASEHEATPDDQQAPPPKPRTRSIYVPERTLHPPIQSSRSVSQCYEILNQIEEGSYGVVFRAREVQTGDIVALKRLKLDEEKNGFPITALREIYALMTCRHENVVRIREVVVGETLTNAPEILMGATTYSTAVDMWSVGCIFAELLLMEPLFQAKNEVELLSMIFRLLGPPTKDVWPDYTSLPLAKSIALPSPQPDQFRPKFPHLSMNGIDLIMSLLTYDPEQRITAEEALQHPYFTESPMPKHPDLFGSFPSAAAGEKRRKPDSPSAPARAANYKLLTEFDLPE